MTSINGVPDNRLQDMNVKTPKYVLSGIFIYNILVEW